MEESDSRGWNMGSYVKYCGKSEWYRWIDYVSIWHGPKSNLAFADGHVEHWQWTDPNTIQNAIDKRFFLYDAGNEDWIRMRRAYRQIMEQPGIPLMF